MRPAAPKDPARRRPSLSRDRVLEAALAIANREGVEELTLRRLAGDLGVTPMALYRYFESKAALLDGVLDLVVRQAAIPRRREADWRRWAKAVFLAMRDALIAQPGIMPLLGGSASFGPHAVGVLEEVLVVMRRAGLSEAAAARGFMRLISYTIGAAALELGARRVAPGDAERAAEWRRQTRLRFESLPPSRFPTTVGAAAELAACLTREEYERSLEEIIEGLT